MKANLIVLIACYLLVGYVLVTHYGILQGLAAVAGIYILSHREILS